ncbi:hypothetical protein WCLP8_4870012 [uncultured Gammaproteobacteria bacterium]
MRQIWAWARDTLTSSAGSAKKKSIAGYWRACTFERPRIIGAGSSGSAKRAPFNGPFTTSRPAARHIDVVIKDIERRRLANAAERNGYGGPWGFALALFDDVAQLQRFLVKGQGAICGNLADVAPASALGQKVEDYLAEARRRYLSPDKPNRARVWGQICKIERELTRDCPVSWPLDRDHLDRMMAEITSLIRGGDNNLPRNSDGLEAFYRQFDPRCRDQSMDANQDDDETWQEEKTHSLDEINAMIRITDIRPRMNEAFLSLPINLKPVFNNFLERISDCGAESIEAFCARSGMTLATYHRRIDEAKRHLKEALDDLI